MVRGKLRICGFEVVVHGVGRHFEFCKTLCRIGRITPCLLNDDFGLRRKLADCIDQFGRKRLVSLREWTFGACLLDRDNIPLVGCERLRNIRFPAEFRNRRITCIFDGGVIVRKSVRFEIRISRLFNVVPMPLKRTPANVERRQIKRFPRTCGTLRHLLENAYGETVPYHENLQLLDGTGGMCENQCKCRTCK